MAFKTDTQTVNDLQIIGGNKRSDIYSLFNKTRTRGGSEILEDMFLYPLSRSEEIKNRVSTFRYFKEEDISFPFHVAVFDTIEFYLSDVDERTRLSLHEDSAKRKLERLIGSDTAYQQIHKGVISVLSCLIVFNKFIATLNTEKSPPEFYNSIGRIKEILDMPSLQFAGKLSDPGKPSYSQTAEYDQLFRFSIRKSLLDLLRYAYEIDVFITVAKVSGELGFAYAEINENESNSIDIHGLYHPLVRNAVPNDLKIDEDNNLIFLTGANMAGKSTFMKSFSIAVYLAHMGFPVPSRSMRFNVQNGMFTTINLADNLNMGFSHFYAEVSRVKKVAMSVNSNERLIIVFDELFRGTNVKDACEATIAVVSAFAGRRKCTFIISTHILEAGEVLRKQADNIRFLYLPTVMKGQKPHYTYTIQEGITNDRHGMIIIQNEGILEQLAKKSGLGVPDQVLHDRRQDFITDRQTLEDLNISGRYKSNSIFSLFNRTVTAGGDKLLEQMFQHPLTDAEKINERSHTLLFFKNSDLSLPFTAAEFEDAENYLRNAGSANWLAAGWNMSKMKVMNFLTNDKQYPLLHEGVVKTILLFTKLRDLAFQLEAKAKNTPYRDQAKKFLELLGNKHFEMIGRADTSSLTFKEVSRFDYIFRGLLHNEIGELLQLVYDLDVCIAVSEVARMRKLGFATAMKMAEKQVSIQGLYHPGIPGAVPNDIHIGKDKNVLFLTGANMAGKSTFMKSFGIAVYLAHMGFPVAAKEMTFSVHEGIYTSINVPDNLEMGYSHFYAEVLRVKHVAEEVSTGKQLVVIFDELFKGTNVKDASDGTVAIVDAFSKRNGTFIISTHIMEAGEELKKLSNKLFYKFLPTIVKGKVPTYPYILEDGITDDRQGMMIIKNEKIIETIRG